MVTFVTRRRGPIATLPDRTRSKIDLLDAPAQAFPPVLTGL
jgi:hypothetical protein